MLGQKEAPKGGRYTLRQEALVPFQLSEIVARIGWLLLPGFLPQERTCGIELLPSRSLVLSTVQILSLFFRVWKYFILFFFCGIKNYYCCRVQWCRPLSPATWKTEAGEEKVQALPGLQSEFKASLSSLGELRRTERSWGIALAECLPGIHRSLWPIPTLSQAGTLTYTSVHTWRDWAWHLPSNALLRCSLRIKPCDTAEHKLATVWWEKLSPRVCA